jgi:hypothetical protein
LKPLVHRRASWSGEKGDSPARSVGFVGTPTRPAVDRWAFTFVLRFVQQTSPASFVDLFSTSKRSLPDDVAREPGTLTPADSAEYARRQALASHAAKRRANGSLDGSASHSRVNKTQGAKAPTVPDLSASSPPAPPLISPCFGRQAQYSVLKTGALFFSSDGKPLCGQGHRMGESDTEKISQSVPTLRPRARRLRATSQSSCSSNESQPNIFSTIPSFRGVFRPTYRR